MADPTTERLMDLANALVSDPAYGRGEARYPGTLTVDEAVALARALHQIMDGAASARAQAAERRGTPIVCTAGCHACCEELVMVFRPEALAIARWLERPENAATREAFLEAYPSWKERVGQAAARMADIFEAGDEKVQVAFHMEQFRKRILCAFNRDGLCTIYAVRPLLCRNAHALHTPAHCAADDPTLIPATRLAKKSVDEFYEHARLCVRAAHHAIGGPRMRPGALCEEVHRLLGPES